MKTGHWKILTTTTLLALAMFGLTPSAGAQSGGPQATNFTVLHSFSNGFSYNNDGAYPRSGLILSGSTLYGTASAGGTNASGAVFAINTDGTGFTNLYNFTAQIYSSQTGQYSNSDGAYPYARLILSGSTLYGTTTGGGANGHGTVFAVNTNGTGFTNLYSFPGSGNVLYARSGLILSGSTLYGTTFDGGTNGVGTVFAINTDGTGFTNLYSFSVENYNSSLSTDTNNDGANPDAGLIISGNTLYGTTPNGGANGAGTVFAINTDGTGFKNLHNGNYSDGAAFNGSLVLSGNTLYGTAEEGGANFSGTVFAINTDGTGYTNLYSFPASSYSAQSEQYTNSGGAFPEDGLILSSKTLCGTTSVGDPNGNGTVFAVNTGGTGFTNLYSFTALSDTIYNNGTNGDGAEPNADLVLSGNTLYGTAVFGGSSGYGTVFGLSLPVLPTPPLSLGITTASNQIVISWPTNATGYALQSVGSLSGSWSNVTSRITVAGTNYAFTNTMAGNAGFFRLKQ